MGIVISCGTKQTGWNVNTVAGKKLGIYYSKVKLTTCRYVSMTCLLYVPPYPPVASGFPTCDANSKYRTVWSIRFVTPIG
jgi:hypothetical protein